MNDESADTATQADTGSEFGQMIKAEVARLRAARQGGFDDPPAGAAAADGEPVAERSLSLKRVADTASPSTDKLTYSLEELLVRHDEDFVRNVYFALFKREPDLAGFVHYVHALRDGRLSKFEVIDELRGSVEGHEVGVTVTGIRSWRALRRMRGIPILGRLIAIVQYAFRLPELARSHERLEAALYQQQSTTRHDINASLDEIEQGIVGTAEEIENSIAAVRGQVALRVSSVETRMATLHADVAMRAEVDTRFTVLDGNVRERAAQMAEQIRDSERVNEARCSNLSAELAALTSSSAPRAEVDARLAALGQALEERALDRRVSELALHVVELVGLKADRTDVESSIRTTSELVREVQQTLAARMQALDAQLSDAARQSRRQQAASGLLDEAVGLLRGRVSALDADKADRADLTALAARADFDALVTRLKVLPEFADRTDELDAFYAEFEGCFRGSREVIKQRVMTYLPLVRDAQAGTTSAPVVDIGCGRGEWLEVLHDHQLAARGVDTNRVMVATCRERQLDVTEGDGIEYLRAQAPGSLGAVTAIHVIEHLPFVQLIALFDEALRALRPGGMIAFETPNPENLLVGASTFYLDPTHQRPLAPELVRFIAQSRGFTDVQILRLHPYPVANRVQDGEGELHERFNALLYGPQDYAIVAVKV